MKLRCQQFKYKYIKQILSQCHGKTRILTKENFDSNSYAPSKPLYSSANVISLKQNISVFPLNLSHLYAII